MLDQLGNAGRIGVVGLRPGTLCMWAALSSQHSTWSSRRCQTGFQEHSVDSIPTRVTR